MVDDRVKLGDEISSGLKTEAILEGDIRGFAVRWIEWDSDFRRTDLHLGDVIIGVDGESMVSLLQPQKISAGIGQYGEKNRWKEKGAKHGQAVCLQVLREDQQMEIIGKLHANYCYSDIKGNAALGPGGPDRGARDNFEYNWSGWYEKFVDKIYRMLNFVWIQSLNTRRELTDFLTSKERIDFLLENYPGPFAEACAADWERVKSCLQGKRRNISAADLEYREIGAKHVEAAIKAAASSWKALLNELSAQIAPAFPAVSIYDGETAAGKAVELPRITYKDILNSLGKSFAVFGSSSDGYYFMDLERPEVKRFYTVMYRYKGQINPKMKDQYRYIGEIQNDPRLIVVGGRAVLGLTLKPIGAIAGEEECFVDLRPENPHFAGEESLTIVDTIHLTDQAGPAEVIQAMISTIKLGDYASWKSLLADWKLVQGRLSTLGVNRILLDDGVLISDWEYSRKLIMGEVYDVRVEKTGKMRRIVNRDLNYNIPEVDEVTVSVDHFGLFDGEYLSFNSNRVRRTWTLQRLDGGPWKIATIQHL